jgi:hypothetical protein
MTCTCQIARALSGVEDERNLESKRWAGGMAQEVEHLPRIQKESPKGLEVKMIVPVELDVKTRQAGAEETEIRLY